jgi:GH24 family phage-related lysozyme (muramidase)
MTRKQLEKSLALWQERESRFYKNWQGYKNRDSKSPRRAYWFQQYQLAKSMVLRRKKQLNPPIPKGVSDKGVNFVKEFEGFTPYIYDDATNKPWGSGPGQSTQGTATIGYGTTKSDINPLPKHMTEATATHLLKDRLNRKYYPAVAKALAPIHPTQNQIDAATSFAYNLGEGAFQGVPGFETLTRAIKAKSPHQIADAFLRYYNPGSVWAKGLRRRREAERKLFLS